VYRFRNAPLEGHSYFYSLVAISLAVLVTLTVASEFYRGGKVTRDTRQGMFASIVHVGTSNTRRYGGYIVHFGVAVVIIGFVGAAFNQDKEKEMGFGDQLQIGSYTLAANRTHKTTSPTTAVSGLCLTCSRVARKSTLLSRAPLI